MVFQRRFLGLQSLLFRRRPSWSASPVTFRVIYAQPMPDESHFNRWLFWLTILAVIVAQFALCYEALVCRGYPPLTEIGLYKKWASPFVIWIPAIFATRPMRFWGLVVLSISTTCLFVMVSINGMVVPSIGHLAGVQGIIQFHYPEIVVNTLFCFPFVFAIMYFPERAFGDIWRAICRLPTASISFVDTWRLAWRTKASPSEPT
jgi:hypothetical protein